MWNGCCRGNIFVFLTSRSGFVTDNDRFIPYPFHFINRTSSLDPT